MFPRSRQRGRGGLSLYHQVFPERSQNPRSDRKQGVPSPAGTSSLQRHLQHGCAGWMGQVWKMKEGTEGNRGGQTKMIERKTERVLSVRMTRESIPFHPGAEHASSLREANCAVTLSLSVRSMPSCQRRKRQPQHGSPSNGTR